MSPLPPALQAYRAATQLAGPAAPLILKQRAARGKESPERMGERLGHASLPRPDGPLVWLHAVSVGEASLAMGVAEALTEARPGVHTLLTTATATAAALAGGRGVRHQFAPIDRLDAVQRFLGHWRPDLAVFLESELWPNLIVETAARGTRLALLNGRMSAASLARWRKTPRTAAFLLGRFELILAADAATAEGWSLLAGRAVERVGNLKIAAALRRPPTGDRSLREALGGRPAWLAASTHPGEDEIILAAHAKLREIVPEAALILAPRHPERGAALSALASGAPRRSLGEAPTGPVYVADTIGEMGTLLAAADAAFIAGSLRADLYGHTPLEAAALGVPVVSGPHVASFKEVYAALVDAQAVALAGDATAIAQAVGALLKDGDLRSARAAAARRVLESARPALGDSVRRLLELLDSRARA